MKCIDPSRMSAADRLAELGDLLAIGAMRFLARQCKPNRTAKNSRERVDLVADSEASCGPLRMEATT
jgi:hypothetical protein